MSTSSEEEDLAVIIDNGTSTVRAGFAGDDDPRMVWPNLTGVPQSEVKMLAQNLKERYVGDEAQSQRSLLALQYPMKGGEVRDWEGMEQVWEGTFQHLKTDPTTTSVLLSDRPLIPPQHRERMTESMFETFQVPRFYVMSQGVLCWFAASGTEAAVIVDCGEGATTIMLVDGGLTVRTHAILKGEVAGEDLTSYMQNAMMQRGYDVMGQEGLEAARLTKESLCYVAEDYDSALNAAQGQSTLFDRDIQKRYELPDGQLVTLNEERFHVPEVLFQPSLIGKSGKGVHQLVYDGIMKCDIDSRSQFYTSIIPAGGATCCPGFVQRLQKEISALVPPTRKVKVMDFPERKYSAWIGGSIVASLTFFQKSWITKDEYEEHGPVIVHKKCT